MTKLTQNQIYISVVGFPGPAAKHPQNCSLTPQPPPTRHGMGEIIGRAKVRKLAD